MDAWVSAVLLGFALAADAFAAALCQGAALGRVRPHRRAMAVGAAFGAAQGLAPLLGWSFGLAFATALAQVDHWIAFAILSVLGVKLIREGLAQDGCASPRPAMGYALLALAVATSLDAAAAGLAFDALALPPFATAAVIAGVTATVCGAGVYLGRALGSALGGRAEVVGGIVLIGVGVNILLEHRALG